MQLSEINLANRMVTMTLEPDFNNFPNGAIILRPELYFLMKISNNL